MSVVKVLGQSLTRMMPAGALLKTRKALDFSICNVPNIFYSCFHPFQEMEIIFSKTTFSMLTETLHKYYGVNILQHSIRNTNHRF
jgi:hypothetical protein